MPKWMTNSQMSTLRLQCIFAFLRNISVITNFPSSSEQLTSVDCLSIVTSFFFTKNAKMDDKFSNEYLETLMHVGFFEKYLSYHKFPKFIRATLSLSTVSQLSLGTIHLRRWHVLGGEVSPGANG